MVAGGERRGRPRDPLARTLCLSSSLLNRRRAAAYEVLDASSGDPATNQRSLPEAPTSREEEERFWNRFVVPSRRKREYSTHLLDVFHTRKRRIPTVLDESGGEVPLSRWDLSHARAASHHMKELGESAGPRLPLSMTGGQTKTPGKAVEISPIRAREPSLDASLLTPADTTLGEDLLEQLRLEDEEETAHATSGARAEAAVLSRLPCGHAVRNGGDKDQPGTPKAGRWVGGGRPQYMRGTQAQNQKRLGAERKMGKQEQRRRANPTHLVAEGAVLGGGLSLAVGVLGTDGRPSVQALALNSGRCELWRVGGTTVSEAHLLSDSQFFREGRGLAVCKGKLYSLVGGERVPAGVCEYDCVSRSARLIRTHSTLSRTGLLCAEGSTLYYCCCRQPRRTSGQERRDETPSKPCGGLFSIDLEAAEVQERRIADGRTDPRLAGSSAMAVIHGRCYVAVPGEEGGLGSLLEVDRGGRVREVRSGSMGETVAMCAASKRLYVSVRSPPNKAGLWEVCPVTGALERRLDSPGATPPQALSLHDGRLYALQHAELTGSIWEYVVSTDRGGTRADRLPFTYDDYLGFLAAYERCNLDPTRSIGARQEGTALSELQLVLQEIQRSMPQLPAADKDEYQTMQRERRPRCDFYEVLHLIFPARPLADLRRTRQEHQQEKQRREEARAVQQRAADWRNRFRDRYPDDARAEHEIAEVERLYEFLCGGAAIVASVPVQRPGGLKPAGLILEGLIVTSVIVASAAERAGVEQGWRVVSVDGREIFDAVQLRSALEGTGEVRVDVRKPQEGRVTAEGVMRRLPQKAVLRDSDVKEVLLNASSDMSGKLRLEEVALLLDEVTERDSMIQPDLYFQAPTAATEVRDTTAAQLDGLLFPTELDTHGMPRRAGALERAARPHLRTAAEPTSVALPEFVASCRICRRQQPRGQG
eukprot:Hpha_TRINITY_DN26773_c0_g1::TRINITY_DN26773_c0_g1_i1::g.138852::m.138852